MSGTAPVGTVIGWTDEAGPPPPGWEVADGRRYRRGEFPDLYDLMALVSPDPHWEHWWERWLGWRRLPDFRDRPAAVGGEPVVQVRWVIRVLR
jgi:hypothetical protein